MSYETVKWLILVLPTLTIGLWEYVRHTFLLPYISMDLGNLLSPVILFAVTITLTRKLFLIYEAMQEEVRQERARKAATEERERLVRQLHDGLAQSLFLLSVQIEQMERNTPAPEQWNELKKSVRVIHEYTRQAMNNLKTPKSDAGYDWLQMMRQTAEQFQRETGLAVAVKAEGTAAEAEKALSAKERVALHACLQEALMNVRKHAKARRVDIFFGRRDGWLCLVVEDDGIGFVGEPWNEKGKFGVRIMRERAAEVGWQLKLERSDERTRLILCRPVTIDRLTKNEEG